MILRKAVELDKEKPIFQLFFLKNDKNQSVNVEEVEEIDFRIVKNRLEKGESVFISRKRKQKLNTTLVAKEDSAEPWYFSHI